MKLFAVVFVLLLVQLTSAQFMEETNETAPYDVIRFGDGFEERLYPSAKWVCHNSTSKSDMLKRSFILLFRYITGSNDREMMIPWATPGNVEMRMESSDISFIPCFYLPSTQQASPPLPTNPEVYIQDRPEISIYARIFGGFAIEDFIWEKEFQLLAKALLKDGVTDVDFHHFYSAGYDPPMKLKNRRNEIWYLKKD